MKQPRILWREPISKSADVESFANFKSRVPFGAPLDLQQSLSLRETLFITGIPSVEGAATPKEDAIGLLMLAAEVEHALMVQYLYAAQSLRGSAAKAVAQIAVQEMGHLITVQNLLLALTGVTEEGLPALIHLGRDALRQTSDHNPLLFTLEKVTHATLAKFTVVERPEVIPDQNLRTRIAMLEAEVSHVRPHPVYALYAAIRWLFQSSDEAPGNHGLSADLGLEAGWHVKEQDFVKPEIVDRFASTEADWHSIPDLIVASVRNHEEAIAAIDAITAQGEGTLGSTDSHFFKYLELLDLFESNQIPVKPLPQSPYVAGQDLPEDPLSTEITNDYTQLWGQLFNLQYELLLVDIAWAISQPNDGDARKELIDATIFAMNNVIQPISKDMTERWLDEPDGLKAGPPYGLANQTIPSSMANFRNRFDFLLEGQRVLMEKIKSAPEWEADFIGINRFNDIALLNSKRAPHLPKGI